MKKNLLLLAFAIMARFVFAQGTFEGTITMIPDFKGKPDPKNNMVFNVKGTKSMMQTDDMKANNSKMIMDMTTHDMYMLSTEHGQKVAMKMNMATMMQMAPQAQQHAPTAGGTSDVKYDVTGVTRTIDGYTARQVTWSSSEGSGESWVADGVNVNFGDMMAMSHTASGANMKGDGFPLESWGTNAETKKDWSMKMTPEAKTMNAADFEIPADYQVMDMAALMQQMQNNPQAAEQMQKMMEMFGGGAQH